MTPEEQLHLSRLELFRAESAYEHAALKPLFLLNGGAVVAVMTFAGHNLQVQKFDFALPVLAWSLGLVCAAVIAGLGYYSQHCFYVASGYTVKLTKSSKDNNSATSDEIDSWKELESSRIDRGQRSRKWAWILAGVALLLFITGVVVAVAGISGFSFAKYTPQVTTPHFAFVNVAGLLFDIAGVILIFRFGLPEDVRRGGESHLLLESTDESEIDKAKSYDRYSRIGLSLLIIGLFIQAISSLLQANILG